MKNCPNCGKKLHLTDWKPVCPGCGVNLVYFKSNEILLDDSEKAEIEHAKFQPKVDRAKAAYAGSKLAITRIVLTVLPVVSLLIPFCSLSGVGGSKNIGLIDLVKFITGNDIGAVAGKALSGDLACLSFVLLLAAAAMFLVNLICIVMSLGKYGKVRSYILYGIMLVCAAGSAVVFSLAKDFSAFGNYASGKLIAGAFIYIALVLAVFVLNVIIYKKGIPVNYKQCLIGGLDKEEYFEYVKQGMTKEQIRRKMLVALTELQIKAEAERKNEDSGKEVV